MARLPSNYQEVEYLQSSGTQYIDSCLPFVSSTDELKVDYQLMSSDNWKWLFGSFETSARFGLSKGHGVMYDSTPHTCTDSELMNSKHTFIANENGASIDGVNKCAYSSFTETKNIYLFAVNNGSNVPTSNSNTRLYELEWKRNNAQIRHLLPCYRKSDSVAGMYDLAWDNTKCGVKVLNGTENWQLSGTTAYIPNATNNWQRKTNSPYMSNKFINSTSSGGVLGVRFDEDFNIDSYTRIEGVSDIATLKQWLLQQYENGQPLIIYYQRTSDETFQPPFYTNSGTGTFVVGPNVKEEVETYTECYVIPNPAGHDLPSGYTEVEWLESSGTQKISTGLTANQNSKYEVVAKSSNITQYNANICGAGLQYKVAMCPSQNKVSFCWNSVDYKSSTTIDFTEFNTYIEDGGKEYVNDTLIRTRTADTFEFSNLTLFNVIGQIDSYQLKGCISSFKFWQNGTDLSMYLIPCYRKTDNVAGMYDIVNNQFYTNSGTGEFIVGPDVPKHIEQEVYTEILVVENSEAHDLPSNYQEVEYLESSGTQYIDTGYKITTTNYNKLKMNVTLNIIQAGATGWPVIGVGGGNPSWYVGFDSSNVVYYGNIVSDVSTSYTAYRNTFYNYDLDYKELKFTLSNELGTTLVEKNITAVGTPISSDYSMALFGAKQINGSMRCHHMVIKSYQLSDNDVLVRNLIPCYRKSDSVAGMYDLVNNVFYTNSGTGTFAVGPNIDKYTEYEAYTECYIVE